MNLRTVFFSKEFKWIIIPLIFILIISGFIFSNSLKDSKRSTNDSKAIEEFAEPIIKSVVKDTKVSASYIVRKGAHLFEFCLLGMAVMNMICIVITHFGNNFAGYGFFYVLAVAVADEYIQSFSDRTSSVGDILIDFAGACVGFLLILSARAVIRHVKAHNTVTRTTNYHN